MTIRMKLPEGCSSFGVGGVQIEAHNGYVNVPIHFIDGALSVGLLPSSEEAPVDVATFRKGDRVTFTFEDHTVEGNVKSVKNNVVVVLDDEAEQYNVDVSDLTPVV